MRDAIILSILSMQSSEASSACNHGMWSTFEAVNVAPLRNERRVERPVPATIEMSSCPKCTCVLSQQSRAITLHAITLHAITLHAITLHAITLHAITLHAIEMSSCPKCTCVLSQQSCAITLHAITLHAIKAMLEAMLEADLRAFSKVFDLAKHHLNRPREPNDANHQRQVIGQQRPAETRMGTAQDIRGQQRTAYARTRNCCRTYP